MSVPWFLMAKGKGGGGYKTASGPIASVSDALAAPLRSLVANIEPVQEGTGDPSPDNVRPISGWSAANLWRTGKNLLDVDKYGQTLPRTQNGITWSKVHAGVYHVSGTATGTSYFNLSFYSYAQSAMPCISFRGQRMTLSSTDVHIKPAIAYFVEDGSFTQISNGGIIPDDAVGLRAYVRIDKDTAIDTDFSVQLELSSTATPYAPYSGNQFTIQLGQTIYGGTLDVTQGKMVVSHAVVKFGNWMKGLISNYSKNGYYYNGANLTPPMASGSFYSDPDTICSHFAKKPNADSGMGMWIGANSTYFYFVHVIENIPNIETSAKFCEWLEANDVFMTYPLATPITIPLTTTQISTLQGQNNVWADTGDVDVEYIATGGADPDLMKLAVAFMGRK